MQYKINKLNANFTTRQICRNTTERNIIHIWRSSTSVCVRVCEGGIQVAVAAVHSKISSFSCSFLVIFDRIIVAHPLPRRTPALFGSESGGGGGGRARGTMPPPRPCKNKS